MFRHISGEQRTIVITMIAVHLDSLDVIANALHQQNLSPRVREDIEEFSTVVMPPLFAHLSEEPLAISLGLLGLLLDRTHIEAIVLTKVGLGFLTLLISRAETLKENAAEKDPGAQHQYSQMYTALFNRIEPSLALLFPDSNPMASEDVYVWQFLAAMGAAANPEQQQRLVLGVKDRVMAAVSAARTLPTGEKEKRLGEVNLFMMALGLDVELLA